MALDLDNLGPAPDIENIDTSKMDRGDNLVVTPPVVDLKDDEVPDDLKDLVVKGKDADDQDEADDEADDKKAEEEGKQTRERDEKGRFSEAKIPKSRFDEAVGKEREAREAAERRAAELERRLNQTAAKEVESQNIAKLESEIEALEAKHADLLLDGNTAEAAKVMKQIRMSERQIATAEAEARAEARTTQALEADRLEAAIARIEADHPQFNPDSEVFDEDLVALVVSKQRAFIAQGMTPSKAMEKAAGDVASRFLKEPEKKVEEKGLSAAKQDDRKQKAVEQALDAQKRQPASVRDAGMDSDKMGEKQMPDVSKMSMEEFDALPESTKARLRGDLI